MTLDGQTRHGCGYRRDAAAQPAAEVTELGQPPIGLVDPLPYQVLDVLAGRVAAVADGEDLAYLRAGEPAR